MDMAWQSCFDTLTHDPTTNPITVLATFDVGRFLANNVGVVATRANMLPTFPTKPMRLMMQSLADQSLSSPNR
jgi:hypothetical protein